MIRLAITGWGTLCSAGAGSDALATAINGAVGGQAPHLTRPVAALYSEPLPSPEAHALVDFNVRDFLGRKGTSFLDRCTSLALVTCAQALEDSDLEIDGHR